MYTRLLRIMVRDTDNKLVATLFVPLTYKEVTNPLLETNNQCHISWELVDGANNYPTFQRTDEPEIPMPRDDD